MTPLPLFPSTHAPIPPSTPRLDGLAWGLHRVHLLVLLVVLVLGGMTGPSPAQAAPLCRSFHGHTICWVSIKRSAKYYWEYRAQVTLDGTPHPEAAYNCRDRTVTVLEGAQKGQVRDFLPDGPGPLICQITRA